MVISLRKHRNHIIVGFLFMFLPILFKLGTGDNTTQKISGEGYGDYISWLEVRKLFPLYAEATVVDVDTHKYFRVQRRGGSYHADVQPLTAKDTAIMKDICGGWSWRRRAVIIQLDNGKRIAGSMACMPHGAGAIQGNNFNGHFCIHFLDSKTHGSQKVDLSHQIMIWKAADQIGPRLIAVGPEKTLEIFFAAINQGDRIIPAKIIHKADTGLLNRISAVHSVQVLSLKKVGDKEYAVDIRVSYKDSPGIFRKKAILSLISSHGIWQIEKELLIPLFAEE